MLHSNLKLNSKRKLRVRNLKSQTELNWNLRMREKRELTVQTEPKIDTPENYKKLLILNEATHFINSISNNPLNKRCDAQW